MSHSNVPAQTPSNALQAERALDDRLLTVVLKAGGVLFLLFIVAVTAIRF